MRSKHVVGVLLISMLLLGDQLAFSESKNDQVITVAEDVDGERNVHVLSVTEAYDYAFSLEQKDLSSRAVPFYEAIIAEKPDHSDAHARLAYIFYMNKQYDKAQQECEWKIAREPNDCQANFFMGMIYQYGREDASGALKYYEQAVNYCEGHPKAAALEFSGDIYQLALHDWDKAIEYYRLILKIQSNNVKAHFNLGACLANKGQLDEAVVEFKEVISKAQNSDHPELYEKALEAVTAVENARKGK